MKTPLCATLIFALPAAMLAQTTASHPTSPVPRKTFSPPSAANYGKIPLSFEANQGQSDRQVRFVSHGQGYSLFLTDRAAVLALSKGEPAGNDKSKSKPQTDVVRMELAGAARELGVFGADRLPGTANYFIGNDPAKWHSAVPTYAKVKYAGVYPGVDLVYYGNQRQLEYDFVVAPGADPKQVKLHFAGAEKLKLNADGDLTVTAGHGEIAFHKPVVYQLKSGQKETSKREPIDGKFTLLADNIVGFTLGSYDQSRELVIDPTLAYSTYLANQTPATDIAVDSGGNAYTTGVTSVADYPLASGDLNKGDSPSAFFVAKFDPSGSALVYSAMVGASDSDYFGDYPVFYGEAIAVDASGSAYVTGVTHATDFPVTAGVVQSTNHAKDVYGSNAFVFKLTPAGTALVYSTYLGGSVNEFGGSIAVDASGSAYVAGTTYSPDFPVTSGAFQKTNTAAERGEGNVFIAKLNPAATGLVYATYLGGDGSYGADSVQSSRSIVVDSLGNVYVAGTAHSQNFPVTQGVLQSDLPGYVYHGLSGGYAFDGFISKLNPTGSGLVYSTFLGKSSDATAMALAVDASGDAYVAGYAKYPGFPTTSKAFQQRKNYSGAFVSKLNPEASALLYSTYVDGDTGVSVPSGIALDASGDAYVVGNTDSPDFPVTSDAFQPLLLGGVSYSNTFLIKLNRTGSGLRYSTYFGLQNISPSHVAVDSSGDAYLAGTTFATDFPTTSGAFQPAAPTAEVNGYPFDGAFVSKFSFAPSTLTPTTTHLTSSANPVVADQPLSFTAAVSPTTGTAIPTGSVTFSLPEVNAITNTYTSEQVTIPLDSTGHATLSLTSSDPEVALTGARPVGANYNGSSTDAPSSSRLLETVIVGAPVFSVSPGTSATIPLLVSIAAAGSSQIDYTTDGSSPFPITTLLYGGPILITSTETIAASAKGNNDDSTSREVSATYTITSSMPGVIDFGDGFAQTNGLQLLGYAAQSNSLQFLEPPSDTPTALLLTNQYNANDQAGAFYYANPVPVQSFTTDFTFQLTNLTTTPMANGFTFVVQNAGLGAIGTKGSGLGYAGIAKSVAVKFDFYNSAGEGLNSTGLYTDGATPTVPAVTLAGTGINLHSGDIFAAHITYDGTNLVLTLTDTVTKATYSHSFPIDIPGTVGGNAAYVGFTGGTGGDTAIQAILSWTYAPGPVDFVNGFSIGAPGLIQNGKTSIAGAALQLTDGGKFETASAFSAKPVNVQAFTTDFGLQIINPSADGMTFTIQNTGATAIGSHGDGLGYAGIGKSVAIKFDLHNNFGEGMNSTGLYTDGALPTVPDLTMTGCGINLHSGHALHAHITYNGTNLVLTITDTVTSATFTHSFAVDIPTTVGGPTAYVGFTGATGLDTSTQQVLNWTFTNP